MPADGSVATGTHDAGRARRELIAIAQSAALGGQQTTTVPVATARSQPPGHVCLLAPPPFLPLRLILLRTPALPGRPGRWR
jgi:hypothetical protein